ncbi:TRAP transporter large permease [Pseudonocardia sp. MH-G8]|uniref:TRAP transporter large permease n=1 Tax=Pseudonocardia sp. MH-G8 TaxID=1854588 RepID=UPI000B9FCFC8|nr:TRAP transporter large permease [Pseudonocardia sp. MH-G8]OZM76927.1 C4-dicarboxylate ABC transporter permease [Pseudonocardia sp. MH-G8]
MMIAWLFGAFAVLVAANVAVGIALLMAVVIAMAATGTDLPLAVIAQRMFAGTGSFALIAIPAFLLAGELMARGAMARRMVEFAATLVGHLRGGLAVVGVLSTMLFSGVSGSSVANTAAIGSVLVPQMRRRGYDSGFAGAVVANAGVLGSVFPPSIPMVLYGIAAGVSISSLFVAGIVPGILMVVLLIAVGYWQSVRAGYPAGERASVADIGRAFGRAFWALMTPVILVGGIVSGVLTVTEAAVATVVYALLVELLVYRELKPRDLPTVLTRAVTSTGIVMLIIATSTLFGWIMTVEQIPQAIAGFLLGLTSTVWVQLLLINILLLVIGTFLDVAPGIIIAVPILVPLAEALGIDPVHFGVVVVVNLLIGLVTPPVAPTLVVGASIAKVSLDVITAASWRFFAALLLSLALITYVPGLSTWLPGLLG